MMGGARGEDKNKIKKDKTTAGKKADDARKCMNNSNTARKDPVGVLLYPTVRSGRTMKAEEGAYVSTGAHDAGMTAAKGVADDVFECRDDDVVKGADGLCFDLPYRERCLKPSNGGQGVLLPDTGKLSDVESALATDHGSLKKDGDHGTARDNTKLTEAARALVAQVDSCHCLTAPCQLAFGETNTRLAFKDNDSVSVSSGLTMGTRLSKNCVEWTEEDFVAENNAGGTERMSNKRLSRWKRYLNKRVASAPPTHLHPRGASGEKGEDILQQSRNTNGSDLSSSTEQKIASFKDELKAKREVVSATEKALKEAQATLDTVRDQYVKEAASVKELEDELKTKMAQLADAKASRLKLASQEQEVSMCIQALQAQSSSLSAQLNEANDKYRGKSKQKLEDYEAMVYSIQGMLMLSSTALCKDIGELSTGLALKQISTEVANLIDTTARAGATKWIEAAHALVAQMDSCQTTTPCSTAAAAVDLIDAATRAGATGWTEAAHALVAQDLRSDDYSRQPSEKSNGHTTTTDRGHSQLTREGMDCDSTINSLFTC